MYFCSYAGAIEAPDNEEKRSRKFITLCYYNVYLSACHINRQLTGEKLCTMETIKMVISDR